MPLLRRFRRGEGQLLAVNLSIVVASGAGPARLAAQLLVSGLVLTLLYYLNDLFDAPNDVNDPGKDQALVRYLLRNRTALAWWLFAEHLAMILLARLLLGTWSALAVLAVFVVNLAYSAWLKGKAAVDVPWVAVWGAAYALVTGVVAPASLFAIVGAMTGITHIFQITRDRGVDAVNGIRTSAVAGLWLPPTQLAIASAVMGVCLGIHLGPWVGASAAVPFLLYVFLASNQTGWLLAKAYYGLVWIVLLIKL